MLAIHWYNWAFPLFGHCQYGPLFYPLHELNTRCKYSILHLYLVTVMSSFHHIPFSLPLRFSPARSLLNINWTSLIKSAINWNTCKYHRSVMSSDSKSSTPPPIQTYGVIAVVENVFTPCSEQGKQLLSVRSIFERSYVAKISRYTDEWLTFYLNSGIISLLFPPYFRVRNYRFGRVVGNSTHVVA